jgi:hypothetical protein
MAVVWRRSREAARIRRCALSEADERQARLLVEFALQVRGGFDEDNLERRPDVCLQEVAAVRRAIGTRDAPPYNA